MSFLAIRGLLLAVLICYVTSQSIIPSTQTNYSLLAFDGSYWRVGIRSYKGTISLIQPVINQSFSFINDDQAGSEYSTGQNWHAHGDVTFRVRNPDQPNDPYVQYSTVDAAGGPAIGVKPSSTNALAAFDVTNLIKPGHGLQIIKEYSVSRYNHSNVAFDKLTLTIRVQNTLKRRVEIGAFGVSALFSSNWNNMDLPTVATHCSLAEPFIGSNHGFIKVSRLTGEGSVLLVTPVLGYATNTSVYQSSIAAWRHLKAEDRTPTGYGFEGHYEIMALTKAWQDNEWQSVDTSQAWSEPRSRILNPNQTIYFAYEYQLIQDVRSVDNYLVSQEKVNIRGQPGYVVSMPDETQQSNFDQYLFMYVPSHTPNVTLNVTGEGSVELSWNNSFFGVYRRYDIKPLRVGRVKIAVHFSHIENYQTDTYIHLNVLPSFSTQLDRLGSFTEKRQFYTDETDPFGRAYSVMPFDFEADEIILQDSRSYVVGLSDEAGAGPGLAYVSKNRFWPVKSQIHQLDLYINRTLWGVKSSIPFPVSIQNANHSIHASLFWYPGMPGYKYTVTDGWDQDRGSQLWRSYNYVHPTVLYHSMYRLARDNDRLTTLYTWDWYLKQAYLTFVAMFDNAPYYTQFGLMEGSVFLDLMRDLDLEGMTAEFKDMQQREQGRLAVWQKLPFPFGSEMAWDSTGQEELLMTAHEFGLYDLSNQSLSAILGYTHSVPSWAYHGSSRRFWDYWINGKPKYALPYPERGLHHYGSSLNGKPLLYAYQSNPDDVYLLEVGIGSMTGVLTNIQPSGASGMSFHGDNGLLKHDPFDADYGCALYGHVSSSASYYIHHPMFGPSCYLCHWNATADAVLVTPHDSLRVRMYIEQIGTLIEMETGHIASVEVHSFGKQLIITFANDPNPLFSQYRVKISHPAPCDSRPGCDLAVTSPSSKIVRGAYVFGINTQSAQFSWGGSDVDTKLVDE